MARVRYSGDVGFDFVNLVFGLGSGTLFDPQTLSFSVPEPIEGFADPAFIHLFGQDFSIRRGELVSGEVQEIDFGVFTGEGVIPIDSGLKITGLNVSATDLFDALAIPDPFERLDAAAELVFGGDDMITAGGRDDTILALGGDDMVFAGAGNDVIAAGAGEDVIDGGSEAARPFGSIDSIFGGEDNAAGDFVSYSTDEAGVTVDLARGKALKENGDVDRLIDIEGASGGLGDDTLAGDDGDNFFITSLGLDRVNGRGGLDVVSYRLDGGVVADLAKGTALKVSGGADRLKDVEGVIGSSGDDTIVGDRGDNLLGGGFGGEDVLRGRGGADSFVFSFDAGGMTTISDFASGEDKLLFDRSEFGLTARVKLVIGDDPAAKGSVSSVLFDVASRALLIDADGAGGNQAQAIATLGKVSSLTLDDFALI